MNVLAGGPRPVAPQNRLAGAIMQGRVRSPQQMGNALSRYQPQGARPAGFGNYHVPGAPQGAPMGVHGAMDDGSELDQDQIMQRTHQAAIQAKIAEIMGQMQGGHAPQQPYHMLPFGQKLEGGPQYDLASPVVNDPEGDPIDPIQNTPAQRSPVELVHNTRSARTSNLDALRQRFIAQLMRK